MPDNIIFYFVFLVQIVLVSYYFPRKMLSRISYVLTTYPPSEYPRLYPKPIEFYDNARRNYKNINRVILLAGLLLLILTARYASSGGWDLENIVFPYFMLQYVPMMILEVSAFKYYQLMRKADSRTTRKAELQPRRLFDFVSPKLIGLAAFVYVGFIGFVFYVRQFEFPWFGGYANIAIITAANLFFAGIIAWNMYGKKLDPYQAYEDRKRQITLIVNQLVFVSIAATLFVFIEVTLRSLDLVDLKPVAMSLYFQLLAVISLRALRIENINFEVYKEDPSQKNSEKKSSLVGEEEGTRPNVSLGLWFGVFLGLFLGVFILIEGGTLKGFVMGAVIGMAIGMGIGALLKLRKGNSSAKESLVK